MTRVPKVAEKSNKNGGKGGEAILAAVFGSIFRTGDLKLPTQTERGVPIHFEWTSLMRSLALRVVLCQ